MPHQTLTEELHPVGTQELRQRTHLCRNLHTAEITNQINNIHLLDKTQVKPVLFSKSNVSTRDVRVFLSIKGQLVLCGKVDKGFHGREVSNVAIADLTQQRLQVPTGKKAEFF